MKKSKSIGVAVCFLTIVTLAPSAFTEAQDQSPEAVEPNEAVMPQRRSFVQIFKIGQFVTYSTTANASYSIRLYSHDDKQRIEKKYEQEMKEYEALMEEAAKKAQNAEMAEAKQIELRNELRNATPEERARIVNEMRGLNQNPARFNRERVRRPRKSVFYSVSELGSDFVVLNSGVREVVVPVWSIRSVSRAIAK